jgi:hypothetical protein
MTAGFVIRAHRGSIWASPSAIGAGLGNRARLAKSAGARPPSDVCGLVVL